MSESSTTPEEELDRKIGEIAAGPIDTIKLSSQVAGIIERRFGSETSDCALLYDASDTVIESLSDGEIRMDDLLRDVPRFATAVRQALPESGDDTEYRKYLSALRAVFRCACSTVQCSYVQSQMDESTYAAIATEAGGATGDCISGYIFPAVREVADRLTRDIQEDLIPLGVEENRNFWSDCGD